jgi:hypothetical protein
VSVRKRGPRSYQVRVEPFPAQTVPTREAADKLELDLKQRKALGELCFGDGAARIGDGADEATPVTLGEAMDGFEDEQPFRFLIHDRDASSRPRLTRPDRALLASLFDISAKTASSPLP